MILIIDMNYKKNSLGLDEYVLPVADIVKRYSDYEIKHYTEVQSDEGYDAIILSGVFLKDNDPLKPNLDWIKSCSKPVFGICAGMQMIAILFGSKRINCEELGMIKIKFLKENPLFSSDIEAYALHTNAIEPSDSIEVLASSDKCVQAIKVKNKEIYGTQFHPEVRNKDIIKNFISIVSTV